MGRLLVLMVLQWKQLWKSEAGYIHFCILFRHFIELRYIPNSVMPSVIIPLVKNNGDLADASNYRAIAISTALSNLFKLFAPLNLRTLWRYINQFITFNINI